jgi:serine/threonine protein kinase
MFDPFPVCTKIQWIRGALIGKGSFGRVYHAFNVAAGDFIAVKQVETPKTNGDILNAQQQEVVESLYQEITLLKDLDHEHIVEYLGYDTDDSEGVINIFLEYVSGGSISSRLARHGAFEEPVVKHFTRQILLGLEYLHDRSILHRVGSSFLVFKW